MTINKRQFMIAAVSSALLTTFAVNVSIAAEEPTAADLIKEFTGGADLQEGRLTLTTPEIAENGNNVPISVEVDSPMDESDRVESILVVADGNPNPEVITFQFSPLSGSAAAKTRVRLAQTQNVTAVAKMSDGTFQMASNQVKVTIGGCGG